MKILGCLTIRQFPNSNSGGHDCIQLGCSWGVSLCIIATHPSHIHPALSKLSSMWHKGTPFTCNPWGWLVLLSLLYRVIFLMLVRASSFSSPNLRGSLWTLPNLPRHSRFSPDLLQAHIPALTSLELTSMQHQMIMVVPGKTPRRHCSQLTMPERTFSKTPPRPPHKA